MSDNVTKIFDIAHELAARNMEHSDFMIFLSAETGVRAEYAALLARLETAEQALEEARKVIAPFVEPAETKWIGDRYSADTDMIFVKMGLCRRAAEWMQKYGEQK